MNKSQKNILAIITPIILLISGYGYITSSMTRRDYTDNPFTKGLDMKTVAIKWDEFERTWKIWLIIIISIAIIEMIIFSEKKKK